ncbi:MAG: hypothetical protein JF616_12395 [Fibrobacteres bacterium]|jgi:hypothetical protein|nr:hypothetical protein [Fibrobacterota bacterium]
MKTMGMKAGVGGATVGILGLAICCLAPGLGIAAAAGVGAGLGFWTESAFVGIAVASLGLLAFMGYSKMQSKFKMRRQPASAAKTEAFPIACDPSVFPMEKRLEHVELAKDILLRWPKRKEELEDGYLFHYEGDEEMFLALARWAADEHRCCPWGAYAIEAGPSAAGKPGAIKLRWGGSQDGKAFLTDALKFMEDLGGDAPPESILNPDRKLTRASFQGKPKARCGC